MGNLQTGQNDAAVFVENQFVQCIGDIGGSYLLVGNAGAVEDSPGCSADLIGVTGRAARQDNAGNVGVMPRRGKTAAGKVVKRYGAALLAFKGDMALADCAGRKQTDRNASAGDAEPVEGIGIRAGRPAGLC